MTLPILDFRSYAQAELVVIGDSHCILFNGQRERLKYPHIPDLYAPQIRTFNVGPATAWNMLKLNSTSGGRENALMALEGLKKHGFQGWLMLSFGSIDIHRHISQHATKIGFEKAVKNTADRYIKFIDEAKQIYPKLAIWGPLPSVPTQLVDTFEEHYGPVPTTGTECDRNFAALLLTAYLERKLSSRNIPLLSLIDVLIDDDGKSHVEYFWDGIHLDETRLFPLACDLLQHKLGINVAGREYGVGYRVRDIAVFQIDGNNNAEAGKWFGGRLPHDALVDSIRIEFSRPANLGEVWLSLDRNPDRGKIYSLGSNIQLEAGVPMTISIKEWGKMVCLKFQNAGPLPKEICVRGPVGYFSGDIANGSGQLKAMKAMAGILADDAPEYATPNVSAPMSALKFDSPAGFSAAKSL